MSGELLMAFWGVSFLLVITPGMDWAFAISAGLRRHAVLPAVGGLLSGHLFATLLVVAGAGVLVLHYPLTLTVMTILGALYLLWLGINMLCQASVPVVADEQQHDRWWHWLIRGACVSGMNPKVFLLFLALLPQFTDPHGSWPLALQMLLLGLLHLFSCGLVYLAVGFGAGRLLAARRQASVWLSRASGIAMTLIAIGLLIEQF